MNDLFVNVKVDREERPDVDAVTMEATVGMTGSGGWPNNGLPHAGRQAVLRGTYFPPEPRHGIPNSGTCCAPWPRRGASAARTSSGRPGASTTRSGTGRRCARRASRSRLRSWARPHAGSPRRSSRHSAASAARQVPGCLDARVPAPPRRRRLARHGREDPRRDGGRRHVRRRRRRLPPLLGRRPLARPALREDALRQRVLASTYLHAWVVTGKERYREVVEETLDYLLREMLLPEGGFSSAQDADTDGVKGLTYTWTEEEARAVGIPRERLEPFEHGRLIVRGELDAELRTRLLEERAKRAQPFRDDKALASWNGLALAALAEAGYRLERDDWVEAARRIAEFVLGPLSDEDGRLLRSRRDGRASGSGFLDDYANVAYGLLELHVATGELRWLLEARRLALLAVDLFADEERGGFYLSPADGDARVPRTKDLQDTPIPSGNSMLAWVLLRLARIWGDDELERRAVSVFRLVEPALRRAPGAFAWMLCGLDLWLSPPREIAIAGPVSSPVARAALAGFDPRAVVAVDPPKRFRSSRARAWSTASRRSTSASASSAGLR